MSLQYPDSVNRMLLASGLRSSPPERDGGRETRRFARVVFLVDPGRAHWGSAVLRGNQLAEMVRAPLEKAGIAVDLQGSIASVENSIVVMNKTFLMAGGVEAIAQATSSPSIRWITRPSAAGSTGPTG